MKKKQIIGLGTLLLVLLLGSFTTSYAMSVSQAEECMQYITDQYDSRLSYYKVCVPALIDSNFWQQHKNEIGFDTYNTIIMRCRYESATVRVDFITLNTDNTYINNATINFNTNYATISNVRVCRFNMSRTGVVSSYSVTTDNLTEYSMNRNPTSMDVWCAAVIQANNIVNNNDYFYYGKGFTAAVPFMFVPKSANTYADVWTYEDVPLYNASGDDLYIGQLFHPMDVNIDTNIRSSFYWQYGTWNLRQLPYDCTYLRYVDTQNDVVFYDVYLKSQYIYANNLYEFVWQDRREEPYNTAYGMFYIKDINTIVTSGVLNTALTFSGDYKEKYDNELQNEQDINNISQAITGTILDDSEVDNILAQFNTSGEIKEALGFHDYADDSDLPFTVPRLFIEHVIVDTLEVLVTSGDTYVDIPIDNNNRLYRVYARYFTTPEDNTLMLFVRTLLIFGSIYCLYTYFVDIADSLTTFNLYDVTNKVDTDRYIYRM